METCASSEAFTFAATDLAWLAGRTWSSFTSDRRRRSGATCGAYARRSRSLAAGSGRVQARRAEVRQLRSSPSMCPGDLSGGDARRDHSTGDPVLWKAPTSIGGRARRRTQSDNSRWQLNAFTTSPLAGRSPSRVRQPKCANCSLLDLCLPPRRRQRSAAAYLDRELRAAGLTSPTRTVGCRQ